MRFLGSILRAPVWVATAALLLVLSAAYPAEAATKSAIPTIPSVLNSIISKGTAAILADITSADSVAGAVDPNSTQAAPYNTYDPLAHLCFQEAIPFLTSLPSPATIPSPTGTGGIITTVVMAQVKLAQTQAFIAKLSATGFPPNLKYACSAFALSIINAPGTILANANSDFINFLTLFAK